MIPLTTGPSSDPGTWKGDINIDQRAEVREVSEDLLQGSTTKLQRPKSVGSSDSGYSGLYHGEHSELSSHGAVNSLSADAIVMPHDHQQAISTDGLISDNNNISLSLCGSDNSCRSTTSTSTIFTGEKLTTSDMVNDRTHNGNNSLGDVSHSGMGNILHERLHTARPTSSSSSSSSSPGHKSKSKIRPLQAEPPDKFYTDGVKPHKAERVTLCELPNSVNPYGDDSIICEAPVILINGGIENTPVENITFVVDTSSKEQDSTCSLSSGTSHTDSLQETEDDIILPDRFRVKLKKECDCDDLTIGHYVSNETDVDSGTTLISRSGCGGHSTKCESCSSGNSASTKTGQEDSPERRTQDVTTALQWLRQEMLQMKAQDKVLMRQFLDLRASIHGLRGLGLTPRSVTDLTSVSSRHLEELPCASMPRLSPNLTKRAPPSRVGQLLPGDECEVEFRARTVSALPARPRNKLQVKAFSKETV